MFVKEAGRYEHRYSSLRLVSSYLVVHIHTHAPQITFRVVEYLHLITPVPLVVTPFLKIDQ